MECARPPAPAVAPALETEATEPVFDVVDTRFRGCAYEGCAPAGPPPLLLLATAREEAAEATGGAGPVGGGGMRMDADEGRCSRPFSGTRGPWPCPAAAAPTAPACGAVPRGPGAKTSEAPAPAALLVMGAPDEASPDVPAEVTEREAVRPASEAVAGRVRLGTGTSSNAGAAGVASAEGGAKALGAEDDGAAAGGPAAMGGGESAAGAGAAAVALANAGGMTTEVSSTGAAAGAAAGVAAGAATARAGAATGVAAANAAANVSAFGAAGAGDEAISGSGTGLFPLATAAAAASKAASTGLLAPARAAGSGASGGGGITIPAAEASGEVGLDVVGVAWSFHALSVSPEEASTDTADDIFGFG